MTYIQTPHYTLQPDRLGNLTLRNRVTGRTAYFQGDDVLILEADLEHCPARLLDTVLDQYEGVLK
jgi:hypothetical protein